MEDGELSKILQNSFVFYSVTLDLKIYKYDVMQQFGKFEESINNIKSDIILYFIT